MQCPFCNYEIKEQAQFCQKCGKKIPRCPTCGKAILKKSRFCPVDGTPLPDDLFSVCVENQKINNMPEMPIQKYDDEDMIYSDDKSQNPKRGIVFLLLGCVFLCAICIFVGYAVVTHNMNYESESIQAEMQNDAEQNIIDNQQQQPNDFSDITSQQQQELSQIATQAPSIVQNKNVPSVTMNMVTSAIGTSNFSETVDGQAITHYGDFVLDNDVSTAWIEGVDGYGLGESLTMQLQENCIVTGF